MKKVVLIGLPILLIAGCFKMCSSNTDALSASSDKSIDTALNASKTVKESLWQYSEDIDKMTDKKKYLALLESTNTVEFEFPYSGGSKLNLYIRNEGKENEVFFVITKGQIIAGIDNEKTISVRFDGKALERFNFTSTSDGSSDCGFLTSSNQFIKKLKNSKKIVMEVEFFDHGRELFEFETAGLVWAH